MRFWLFGILLAFLSGKGYGNLAGFDLSPENVRICQERGLGFRALAVVEPLGLEAVAGGLPEHKIRILDLRLENHSRL